MILLSEIALILIWVVIAYWHSRLIKKNRPILHGLWAALAVFLILAAAWWRRDDLGPWWRIGLYLVAQACARLTVFNVCLNWFRGLSWTYISPSSTSILDKAELRVFGGKTWLLEIACAVFFLIAQFPFI